MARAADGDGQLSALGARIDRQSPVPLYFQLERALEQEITSGTWQPGGRLPSEPVLTEHFGVSRSVVRQALARLEQDGLLRRVKGRGTFVAESTPRSWLLQSAEGFFQDEVGRLGRSVTSRILASEVDVLEPWACDALGLPTGARGVTLQRVRAVDGVVAMYNVNQLPEYLATTVLDLDANASLYAALREQHGLIVAGGHRRLEAVSAGSRLAGLLDVDQRAPLLFVESVSWDHSRRPFECYRSWLRTDRMKIDMQVGSAYGHEGESVSGAAPADG